MSANDIVEDLFQSISKIAEKHIANLDYDKTIVCTVTDISDSKQQNLYAVTDGSTTFQVQGDGGNYIVGDQVRVLIVNGDFTKEKYIQGKHSSTGESTKPITYTSPLDSVLKITDNLINENMRSASIAANGSVKEIQIADVEFTSNEVQNSDIFDSLFIQAEFQTNFDQYAMRSGDYGLHLKLISQVTQDTTTSYDVYGLDFSSTRDMFGNPYAFKIYTLQEIKYALSQWPENLVGLQLWLYQDGNFKYVDDTKLDKPLTNYTPQIIDDTEIKDIKVQNIIIGFGSEITAIENNKVKIYTNDLKTYHSDDSQEDIRNINLLWYNRDADNKYLGFSDGKYDTSYDEDAYLQAASKNTRLLQRQSSLYPADQISLSLLADMYDIKTQGKQAVNIIGINLNQTLQGFKNYTFGINWGSDNPFTTLLGTGDGSLGKYATNIENTISELGEYYDTILQHAKDNSKALKTLPEGTTFEDQIETLQSAISTNLTSVDTAVKAVLAQVKGKTTDAGATYPSYADVYETYYIRLTKLLNELVGIKTKIENLAAADPSPVIQPTEEEEPISPAATDEPVAEPEQDTTEEPVYLTNEADVLKTYTNAVLLNKIVSSDSSDKLDLTQYRKYIDLTTTDDFKNTYDNKYCIYWYRYNKDQLGKDAHAPEGWERLTSLNNKGLPGSDGAEEEPHYKSKSDSSAITIELREKPEEKFMAIIFANHKKFVSNELVFDNLTPIPDITSIDATGSLSIEHYKRGDVCNSQNSYQLYDSNGMLINAAEAQYKREIRARFASQDKGDEQLIGAYIYWYVPTTATMLEVFKSEVSNTYHEGRMTIYYSEDEVLAANTKGTYRADKTNVLKVGSEYKFCFIDKDTDNKDVVKTFSIPAKIYESVDKLNDADTTIEQLVRIEDTTIYYKIYKYDSKNKQWIDTDKSINDITVVFFDTAVVKPGYDCYYKLIGQNDDGSVKVEDTIFPYHIKNYYQQTATQNTILCIVKKDANTYQTSQSFEFTAYGNSGTDYTLALTPNLEYPLVASDKDLSVQVALYDADGKNIDITIPTAAWLGPHGYIASAKESSGYSVNKDTNKTNVYAGILKCELQNVKIADLDQNITLTSYLPIPYGINKNLYIEGASTILYDSNGSNPQYYKNPYKLYNKLDNTIYSAKPITWSMQYYCASNITYDSKTFNRFWLTTDTITINGNTTKDITLIHFEGADESGYKAYEHPDLANAISLKYLPRLDFTNTIIPSGMYITYTNADDAIYPVVMAIAKEDDKETVIWAQPIHIYQNNYSSAILNKWKGGLYTDEKTGTILSTMMGAGRKNSNNQFEGILMGDVGASGDDALNSTGLYGFHDGAQSFGFKIDGTAFLGKQNGGRIEFNGTKSTITSVSYKNGGEGIFIDLDSSPYFIARSDNNAHLIHIANDDYYLQSKNYTTNYGMKIDLKTGHIDAYNFKLTSGTLFLTSNGATYTVNTIGDINNVVFGANNNFALTQSGDIYAMSGRIAGWHINTALGPNNNEPGIYNSFTINSDTYTTGLAAVNGDDVMAFWAGAKGGVPWTAGVGAENTNFYVTNHGHLYAKYGKLGPWELGPTYLKYDDGSTANDNKRTYIALTSTDIAANKLEATKGRLGYAYFGHNDNGNFSEGYISQHTNYKCFLEWYSGATSTAITQNWVGMTPNEILYCSVNNNNASITPILWQNLITSSFAGDINIYDTNTSHPYGVVSLGKELALAFGRIDLDEDQGDEIKNIETRLKNVYAFAITPQIKGTKKATFLLGVAYGKGSGGLNTKFIGDDRFNYNQYNDSSNFQSAPGWVPVVWNAGDGETPYDAFYIAIGTI